MISLEQSTKLVINIKIRHKQEDGFKFLKHTHLQLRKIFSNYPLVKLQMNLSMYTWLLKSVKSLSVE